MESFGLAPVSEQQFEQLEQLIGPAALTFLREQEAVEFFYSENSLSNQLFYLVHMYDRAVELKFKRNLDKTVRKSAKASFVFWNDYVNSSPDETVTTQEEKQKNTLKFLHTLKEFFRQVSADCTIVAGGSEEQRSSFWKRQISLLNREGHTNIIFDDRS